MIKEDCFAFVPDRRETDGGYCRVIRPEYFEKEHCEKCPFHKTVKQLNEEEQRTKRRLERMGYVVASQYK